MNEILTVVFILAITLSAINLTCISINHYLIKAEINDILDKKLRYYLLKELSSINRVFFKKILFTFDKDYFNSIDSYISYRSYLETINIKRDVEVLFYKDREVNENYNTFTTNSTDKEVMILEEQS